MVLSTKWFASITSFYKEEPDLFIFGSQCNDTADTLARLSTVNGPSPTEVVFERALTKLSMSESSSTISEHCWQLWHNQYTASNKATHYKLLFPHVARTLQYPLPPQIFRLCTGHCQLNGHLHKLELHLDGRCDTCATSATVEHYLIHCSKFNRQRTAFTSNIRALQINFDWITYSATIYPVLPKTNRKTGLIGLYVFCPGAP